MRARTDWDSALEGVAAGATLVTANVRLARRLSGEEVERRRAAGERVWRRGDVLPWTAWMRRLYMDALAHAAIAEGEASILLSDAQAEALWQRIIDADPTGGGLLQPAAAARRALEAHALCRAWRLDAPTLAGSGHHEDVAAFLRWWAALERRLHRRRWLLDADLPDRVPAWLERVPALRPDALYLGGFDEPTPQQQALVAALEALGVVVWEVAAPAVTRPAVSRLGCTDAEAEMAAAASWTRRALAANPRARLGLVVHDLAVRRSALARHLDRMLHPGSVRDSAAPRRRAWNLSLGRPLADEPVVDDALLVIAAAGGRLSFEAASRLLRSPFVAGGETEHAMRLRLERRLRDHGDAELRAGALLKLAREPGSGCGQLAACLARLLELAGARRGRRRAGAWAEHFAELLDAAGWPGERGLDSNEHQALAPWQELLEALAGLGMVLPPLRRGQALERLRRLALGRIFQPRAGPAPVQVLGLLEAFGQRFDGLWVMGLHDEVWPEPPRPNPFLPVRLQRALGLPHASAARELAFAERVTRALLAAAPEVVVSWPRRAEDRRLRPSPLIAHLPERDPVPAIGDARGALLASARFERLVDARGPDLAPNEPISGGTALFRDQSQCPFRGFAMHRLHAVALERPAMGLDARQRGILVHRVLDRLWAALETRAALAVLDVAERRRLIDLTVAGAITHMARRHPLVVTPRFAEVERERLCGLIDEWLEHELAREDFRVIARERKVPINVGFLSVAGRIDRIDERMDGRRVLVDYKTGDADPDKWLGDPAEEPQLPLYALEYGEDELAGVLMGSVRAGRSGWTGVTRDDAAEPGARTIGNWRKAGGADWAELRRQWRAMAEGLADAIMAGEAAVTPVAGACANCHLPSLCRIDELRGTSAAPATGTAGGPAPGAAARGTCVTEQAASAHAAGDAPLPRRAADDGGGAPPVPVETPPGAHAAGDTPPPVPQRAPSDRSR